MKFGDLVNICVRITISESYTSASAHPLIDLPIQPSLVSILSLTNGDSPYEYMDKIVYTLSNINTVSVTGALDAGTYDICGVTFI